MADGREVYGWDRAREVCAVVGTTDVRHPLVAEMSSWGSVCVSGALQVINAPKHHDFVDLRPTPAQLRQLFTEVDAERVVAFQPQKPLTVRDEQFSKTAAEQCRGTLLINPMVGMVRSGDIDHFTRSEASCWEQGGNGELSDRPEQYRAQLVARS